MWVVWVLVVWDFVNYFIEKLVSLENIVGQLLFYCSRMYSYRYPGF